MLATDTPAKLRQLQICSRPQDVMCWMHSIKLTHTPMNRGTLDSAGFWIRAQAESDLAITQGRPWIIYPRSSMLCSVDSVLGMMAKVWEYDTEDGKLWVFVLRLGVAGSIISIVQVLHIPSHGSITGISNLLEEAKCSAWRILVALDECSFCRNF